MEKNPCRVWLAPALIRTIHLCGVTFFSLKLGISVSLIDWEQVQSSGLALFTSVSPGLSPMPGTEKEHTVRTHRLTQLFIHAIDKCILSTFSMPGPG